MKNLSDLTAQKGRQLEKASAVHVTYFEDSLHVLCHSKDWLNVVLLQLPGQLPHRGIVLKTSDMKVSLISKWFLSS